MTTAKQYYAFISYKRDDQKWAEWLQEKLEHYKLPSNLNGRGDLPKEIRPVFRDKSELAAGVLADEIQKALDNSKYLIVICSPHSAKSEWVNKEVQAFIDSGRTDKIIPFIIEGTPNSNNPDTECFPKAIRELPAEDELLGVNINEMGRDAAAVKVVAQMFGLRFDDLWQRHEREQRRKRFLTIGAALMLALIGVGVAVGFSRQNKRISEQNDKIVLQNEEISKKSDEVYKQNAEISKKNERLQSDSLIMAAQLDSINRRDALIEKQQDSISSTNKNLATANRSLESANKNLETAKGNLETANEQLERERDNLAKTIWKMKENQSKIVAKSIQPLAKEDSYLAKKIAVEILPKDINNPVDRPYTAEAEQALRRACDYDNATFSYNDNVRYVSFSHDGEKMFFIVNNTAVVLNPDNGEEIFKKVFYNLTDIDISYDGKQIAVASDNIIKVFDIETGVEQQNIIGHNNKVYNVVFHPDGIKLLSLALDSTVRVWNTSTGEELLKIDDCYSNVFNDKDVRKIMFVNPDGSQFVLASGDDGYGEQHFVNETFISGRYHTFSFFDIDSGEKLNSWKCKADCFDVNFNCMHVVTFADYQNDVVFRDIYSGKEISRLKNAINMINFIVLKFDGKEFISTELYDYKDDSGYVFVVDSKNIKNAKRFKVHNSIVNAAAYSPDGSKIASCSKDGTIKIWNPTSFETTKTLMTIEDYKSDFPYEAYFSFDKKTIVYKSKYTRFNHFSTWRVFDIKNGLYKSSFNMTGFNDIVLSPDGKMGVVLDRLNASYSDLNVFNIMEGEAIKRIAFKKKDYSPILFVGYTPDNKNLICSRNDTISIFDVETYNVIRRLPINMVTSFVYSSDMNKIVITQRNETSVTVLNPETFEKTNTLEGSTSYVIYACFSHNRKYIAGNDLNGVINIWDAESGELIYNLQGFLNQNNSSFNQDDKFLITKIDHKTLNVWSLETGNCVYIISEEEKFVDYAFTDDGKHIIAILNNGDIRQYDFPPLQDLIDQTRERFKNRPLTDEERKMYYLE